MLASPVVEYFWLLVGGRCRKNFQKFRGGAAERTLRGPARDNFTPRLGRLQRAIIGCAFALTLRGHFGNQRKAHARADERLDGFQLRAAKADFRFQIAPLAKAQNLVAQTMTFPHDDEPFAFKIVRGNSAFARERMAGRKREQQFFGEQFANFQAVAAMGWLASAKSTS